MATTEEHQDGQPTRPASRRVPVALHMILQGVLAVALAVLVNVLFTKIGVSWESSLIAPHTVSQRTYEILSHAQSPVQSICFFDSDHPLLRPASRLLRNFKTTAAHAGGLGIEIAHVDPRRDLVKAKALTDLHVPPNSIVFEGQHGRRVIVSAAEMVVTNRDSKAIFCGETVCAAAIARLSSDSQPMVYWLTGHGEGGMTDYDPETGFSTLAREIRHEGYELRPLALWNSKGVPSDAAALIVVGPHTSFAAAEVAWLDAYLTHGGRLLYLASPVNVSGLEATLEHWGVRVTDWTAVSRETMSGHDIVIQHYADHSITRGLDHSATVFLGGRCIQPALAADTVGADRTKYTPLALTGPEGWGSHAPAMAVRVFDSHEDIPGPVAVAAAVERGGDAGQDIMLQPTRLVVVGEDGFVSNPMLATPSSANRDFLMNALNWLTVTERGSGVSIGGDAALWIGLDQRGWLRLTCIAAGSVPVCVLLVGMLVVLRRRSRGI